jgi:anti-sigma regulatory factor (Ser/Thr protein kinase)
MPQLTDSAETAVPGTSHPRGRPADLWAGGRDLGSAGAGTVGHTGATAPRAAGNHEAGRHARQAGGPRIQPPGTDTTGACVHDPAIGPTPAVTIPGLGPSSDSQPSGQAMAKEWPLHSHLELGALPGAVPCARLHARQVLWEWGLSAFSENAELLVSELVTNAIQASLSGERILPVHLCLSCDRSQLLIEVQDTDRHPPAPTGTEQGDDESGRGLHIVDAISTKWGWHTNEYHSGKIVWALIESDEP